MAFTAASTCTSKRPLSTRAADRRALASSKASWAARARRAPRSRRCADPSRNLAQRWPPPRGRASSDGRWPRALRTARARLDAPLRHLLLSRGSRAPRRRSTPRPQIARARVHHAARVRLPLGKRGGLELGFRISASRRRAASCEAAPPSASCAFSALLTADSNSCLSGQLLLERLHREGARLSHGALGLAALALDVSNSRRTAASFSSARRASARAESVLPRSSVSSCDRRRLSPCAARRPPSAAAAHRPPRSPARSPRRAAGACSSSRRRAREHAFLVVNRRAQGHLPLFGQYTTHPPRVTKRTPSAPSRVLRVNAAVDVVAYRRLPPAARFHRRGVLVRVASSSTSARPRPTAAAARRAQGTRGALARARHEHHLALLVVARRQRRRHGVRPRGVADPPTAPMTSVRPQQLPIAERPEEYAEGRARRARWEQGSRPGRRHDP